jgi:hypothetical protein
MEPIFYSTDSDQKDEDEKERLKTKKVGWENIYKTPTFFKLPFFTYM